MRVRPWLAAVLVGVLSGSERSVAQAVHLRAGTCRWGVLDAEVRAGEQWSRPVGLGLEVLLEPLPSGWILRVLPVAGPRPPHDYAELATPPYASVSPLLISTDFSFRAQDAVAWNPRRFRFAATKLEYDRLAEVYGRYSQTKQPPAMLEAELARLVTSQRPGVVQIVDARLTPGMANQAQTAAMVASHFSTTAHTIEEPAQGKGTPLGGLLWLRLRISLELPEGFRPEHGINLETRPCE